MFIKFKISRAWSTNIHLQMIPHVYLAARSYSALGNTRMYLGTFQMFIHATKITNFWSQQHNLCWSGAMLSRHINICVAHLTSGEWLVYGSQRSSISSRLSNMPFYTLLFERHYLQTILCKVLPYTPRCRFSGGAGHNSCSKWCLPYIVFH